MGLNFINYNQSASKIKQIACLALKDENIIHLYKNKIRERILFMEYIFNNMYVNCLNQAHENWYQQTRFRRACSPEPSLLEKHILKVNEGSHQTLM